MCCHRAVGEGDFTSGCRSISALGIPPSFILFCVLSEITRAMLVEVYLQRPPGGHARYWL